MDASAVEQMIEQIAEVDPEAADQLRALADDAQRERETMRERMRMLGQVLSRKRDEAVAARLTSGIETEWIEDEEAYQGIDDANRGTVATASAITKAGYEAPIRPQQAGRSTVLLNITRPYVDAASARISDMLLPTDDRPWQLRPTPIPELDAALDAALDQAGETPYAEHLKQMQRAAADKADNAQAQIDDWMVEANWHGEVRKAMDDAARLGTAVVKGPHPVKRTHTALQDGMLVLIEEIKPASRRIDPWDFFPDPACGENLHNGAYVWERDFITTKKLFDLIGVPGYQEEEIRAAIEEGPQKHTGAGKIAYRRDRTSEAGLFEVWYWYGSLDREDLIAAGVELEDDSIQMVPAQAVIVNDRVIKVVQNPLDSGAFPYDVFPWQRRAGMVWGMGVARQVRTPQRILTAAVRNLMDNAGLAAGPMVALRKKAIVPADGRYEIAPRKIWFQTEEAEQRSVTDAIASIVIPTMQSELQGIIQFSLKMAEDVTGLPMLLQGQQGQAPDTVGGMQMIQNNASGVLRRIARNFDDYITEPHVRRYYEWLMQYSDDEDLKGDYLIDARGSSALVERDIQNQAILQMGGMVANPEFGINPKKWFEEMCKAQRLDPRRFTFTDEEQAEREAAMAENPPPPPPAVAAAQIRAEVEMQKLQAQMQRLEAEMGMEQFKIQQDTDRDTAYVQAQANRDHIMAQAKMAELELKRELAMLEYANKREMTLEQVKARLAETGMKLNVQRELAMNAAGSAPQVVAPSTEPPGRAPNGQAYQL